MRIYLIGYMGSGKSTLGKELADRLNYSFIDLDSFLEEKYFKTVPQIFAEEGEKAFRIKEQTVLKEVSQFSNVVVATGGGAPCFFDNLDVMNETGYCIFLDVEHEELVQRVLSSSIERPLIKGKSREEMLSFIDDMMSKRRPFYEKAKYILQGNDISADDIIKIIG